jgi:hypothetical protein
MSSCRFRPPPLWGRDGVGGQSTAAVHATPPRPSSTRKGGGRKCVIRRRAGSPSVRSSRPGRGRVARWGAQQRRTRLRARGGWTPLDGRRPAATGHHAGETRHEDGSPIPAADRGSASEPVAFERRGRMRSGRCVSVEARKLLGGPSAPGEGGGISAERAAAQRSVQRAVVMGAGRASPRAGDLTTGYHPAPVGHKAEGMVARPIRQGKIRWPTAVLRASMLRRWRASVSRYWRTVSL